MCVCFTLTGFQAWFQYVHGSDYCWINIVSCIYKHQVLVLVVLLINILYAYIVQHRNNNEIESNIHLFEFWEISRKSQAKKLKEFLTFSVAQFIL